MKMAEGVPITTSQRDALVELTRQQALGIMQMRAQADALDVEAATLESLTD